jgi:hypothetical protein
MGRCIGSLYCSLATSAALRRDIENRPSVPRAVVGCTLREFAVPCVGERASTVHHWRNAAVCTASASHRELAQQKLHGWGSRAHFVLVRHIFVSCSTSMKVAWKMKWSSTSLVLVRIRERADDAVGWAERRSWAVFGRGWRAFHVQTIARSQKAAAHGRGALAPPRTSPRALCMARSLYSGPSDSSQMRRAATCSEGDRLALAAESLRGCSKACLAGSDDAEARWAASGRRGGFAQGCRRRRSFDQRRSDLCSRHPHGSCGRFARVLSAIRIPSESRSLSGLALQSILRKSYCTAFLDLPYNIDSPLLAQVSSTRMMPLPVLVGLGEGERERVFSLECRASSVAVT